MIDWQLFGTILAANLTTVAVTWIALRLPVWTFRVMMFLGFGPKPVYGTYIGPGAEVYLKPVLEPSSQTDKESDGGEPK